MKLFFALLGLLLAVPNAQEKFHETHLRWDREGTTWNERWSKTLAEADNMTLEEKMIIFPISLESPRSLMTNEEKELQINIRTMLLNTPGHAKYYGKKLAEIPRSHERPYWFRDLKNLPSAETVGVLGSLLADDSERPPLSEDRSNVEEYLMANPNSDRAAQALQHLLTNPPVPKESEYEFNRDLETWRLWWKRVKSGRQTFRFVGDPVNYDLRGPSKRGEVVPTERGPKRNAETPQGKTTPVRTEKTSKGDLPYIFGGLFLLAGIILYLRGRKNGD